jgi:lipopolysaccharide export system permease protein
MKLVERYIIKTVTASIILVTCSLMGLSGFILSVNQLDDLGKGHFSLLSAALVVLLSLPYQIYLFFPVASLLGCLLGLGVLANHHELIVMRAAGISIAGVTRAVCKAALLMIIVVTLCGETLVIKGLSTARNKKLQAVHQEQVVLGDHKVWVRAHNDFILLGHVLADNHLEQVIQFHFDDRHQLTLTRQLETAYFNQGKWYATGVRETHLYPDHTDTRTQKSMQWAVDLDPARLRMSKRDPEEMSLFALHKILQTPGLPQAALLHYELAYWQRIVQPMTTVVMMLLAIPFVFGPLRSSTMGSKLLVGVSVGFGFHLLNRFFAPVSQVLHWPPLLAALCPTLLFAMLSLYLMRKVYR